MVMDQNLSKGGGFSHWLQWESGLDTWELKGRSVAEPTNLERSAQSCENQATEHRRLKTPGDAAGGAARGCRAQKVPTEGAAVLCEVGLLEYRHCVAGSKRGGTGPPRPTSRHLDRKGYLLPLLAAVICCSPAPLCYFQVSFAVGSSPVQPPQKPSPPVSWSPCGSIKGPVLTPSGL